MNYSTKLLLRQSMAIFGRTNCSLAHRLGKTTSFRNLLSSFIPSLRIYLGASSVLFESDFRYSILLQLASNVSSACWYIWFMFCTYSSNGIRGRLITDRVWLDICPSLTN